VTKVRTYLQCGIEVDDDQAAGEVLWHHYISTPDGTIADLVTDGTVGGTVTPYYFLYEHLGSVYAVCNGSGSIATFNNEAQIYNFDPWGRRRNYSDWSYQNVPAAFITDRGFTSHEHLLQFDLINMNGRVYDPRSALFLSPDPYIQNPSSTLSHNRYSYCFNNPLKYTDPSGEIVWFVPVIIGAAIGAYTGASIQSGTLNPTKWGSDAWKGAIVGGIIGAGVGFLGAAGLPSLGVNVTTASGAAAFGSGATATSAMSITSQALLSGNIAIGSNYAQGRGLEGAWKAGLIGFGTGALSAAIDIGLTSTNIISTSGTSTNVKLFDSDISAIAHAAGGGTYGAIDRYIRLREEGVRGGELAGYTLLGFVEGAAIGGLSSIYFSNALVQTGFSIAISSVPGLGYSILDWTTLTITHIGGLNKYIIKQTPKYPIVLTIDQIVNWMLTPKI
jgi:RHS repeat-associated protein